MKVEFGHLPEPGNPDTSNCVLTVYKYADGNNGVVGSRDVDHTLGPDQETVIKFVHEERLDPGTYVAVFMYGDGSGHSRRFQVHRQVTFE